MKLKFLDSLAGANFSYRKGQVVEIVKKEEALQYLKSGVAIKADKNSVSDTSIEVAAINPTQSAALR